MLLVTEGNCMAFFGIFIVMWLLILILVVIACAILFVFIPCLVLSIIALVKGVKNNWPRWTKILLPIVGSITVIFIILISIYLVWRFAIYIPPEYEDGSTSEMATSVLYLLSQIKYSFF